jgi:hypothetical protein
MRTELSGIDDLIPEPKCFPFGLDCHSQMKRAYFEDGKIYYITDTKMQAILIDTSKTTNFNSFKRRGSFRYPKPKI